MEHALAGRSSTPAVDRVTVWIVTDNYVDSTRPDAPIARRYRAAPGRSIHAEHGISFFAETVVGGEAHACMYDYGLDPGGVLENLRLLGIDPGRCGAFALSHGHYDHFTSAAAILREHRARVAPGTPFYVGEEAFAQRYALRPGASAPADLGALRRADLESAGARVVEVSAPVEIVPGAWLSGAVPRTTAYEQVPPGFQVRRGERLEHDTFPGEQALYFHVRGKGLVVLSGCAHAGIVNTVRAAQRASGVEKVHAVVGGFHLTGARPEVLRATVADLEALGPDWIVPAHCSGFEALVAFSRRMPDQFVLSTAGAQYVFTA